MVAIFAITFSLSAQKHSDDEYRKHPYWRGMMLDPGVNFYEVQKAFNLYYEGKDMTQEKGWKQFKRWEWNAKRHIRPDGSRIPADYIYKEYQKYFVEKGKLSKNSGEWTNLGPTYDVVGGGGVGRVNAIAFHPTDEDIIYVGTPAGGLWRTTNGGDYWESLTDYLPTMGVSSIVVDYDNPAIIYFGSGDRDAGDAVGMGVFKSTDNGQSWTLMNNGMGNVTVGRLIQDINNPDILLAGTSGGIFKTTDGGQNWEIKMTGNFRELVYKPFSSNVIYATKGGKIYKSTDAGESWNDISGNIMNGARSVIAVTPENPSIVYFLLTGGNEFNALYKSTNSGNSFTLKSTSPNIMGWECYGGSSGQAWYDLDITTNPSMQNSIYAGGVNCWKSSDGGSTWQINSHWYGGCGVPHVHADLHVLEYNPLNNRIYAGNDGGIFYTADGGNTWHAISNNLSIQQVYRIGGSKTNAHKVMVGAQDNGTATYLGSYWKKVMGGDGMDCLVDHTNLGFSYAELYYGNIDRIVNNGNNVQIAGDGVNGMNESGGWITPYCLSEFDHNTMFVGMNNIWRTTSVTSSVSWEKITTIGGGSIEVVEASRADPGIFYYARGKKLYRSDNVMDDAPAWVPLASFVPNNNDIFTIETDPDNPDVVWIGQGTKIYRSEDRGTVWEDISGSLPSVNINSVVYYAHGTQGLYIGTDLGVFYRDKNMDDWVPFSSGLPMDASVNEVEYFHDEDDPSNDRVRAGTYGRGLWESPVWNEAPVADFSVDYQTTAPGCAVNFTDQSTGNPFTWQWTFTGGTPSTSTEQNPSGITFPAAGTYAVSLEVSNASGQDTKTVEGYITVDAGLFPEVDFSSPNPVACTGDAIELYDESIFCPVSWNWEFSPNTVTFLNGTSAASQNPVISLDESGVYSVTLTATNVNGSQSLEKSDFLSSGGFELPYSEDFENMEEPDNSAWSIENPDGMITWEIATAPREEADNKALKLNLYDYYSQAGSVDWLISPPLDFTNVVETPTLIFKHSYARRFTGYSDTLHIYGSTDCGASWDKITSFYVSEDGYFETVDPVANYAFTPQGAEDWSMYLSVHFPQYTGMNNVKIALALVNNFGNNFYIDDIEFVDMPLSTKDIPAYKRFSVYPNPVSKTLFVKSNSSHYRIRITSILGDVLYEDVQHDKLEEISVKDWNKGVYFINLIDKDTQTQSVEKFIVE